MKPGATLSLSRYTEKAAGRGKQETVLPRHHGCAAAGRVTTLEHPAGDRWKFWLVALAWCLLACAFAAAMFWATLRTFDRCLGRMPESGAAEQSGTKDEEVGTPGMEDPLR